MNETLHGNWQTLVARAPDALALIDAPGERRWTRADLAAHAAAFRRQLPAAVARQRVAFALPNGPDWLAVFLGLLEAGATPVPLDPAEPVDAQRVIADAAGAGFARIGGELVSVAPPTRRRAPAPALVKLTSGSTGRPRALPFTHAQMLADGRQVCAGMDIRPDDLNLAVIPFGHSYGLGNLVVPLLAQGTPCLCADLPSPHALAALVARHRPTIFPTVPALLRVLAGADLPGDAFAPVRTVISAGAPLGPEVAMSFFSKYGVRPHGFYGSTETGGISYDRDGDDTLAAAGVGAALPGVTIEPARGGRIRVTG
ncbi:MAG: AMP-binding protein, partial [Verrucomicrobiota bacterium]